MQITADTILEKLQLCADCGRVLRLVEGLTPEQAWDRHPRGDELIWLLTRIGLNRKALTMTLCQLIAPALVPLTMTQQAARTGFEQVYKWAFHDEFSFREAFDTFGRVLQDQEQLWAGLHEDLTPRPELVVYHEVTLVSFLMKQMPLFINSHGQPRSHYSWPIASSYASATLCQGAAVLTALAVLGTEALNRLGASANSQDLMHMVLKDPWQPIRERLAGSDNWQPIDPKVHDPEEEAREMSTVASPEARQRWAIHFMGVPDADNLPRDYATILKGYAVTLRHHVTWPLVEDMLKRTLAA